MNITGKCQEDNCEEDAVAYFSNIKVCTIHLEKLTNERNNIINKKKSKNIKNNNKNETR